MGIIERIRESADAAAWAAFVHAMGGPTGKRVALDVSTDAFQELSFTFRQFRLDSDNVSDALNTIADRAQDAVDGTKSMVDDFALLGVSVDELRGKSPWSCSS